MADFYLDASELTKFITHLNSATRQTIRPASKWIKTLTRFTEARMKRYAATKSKRSTGRLSSSITSRYRMSRNSLSGEVFVPESIKYAWASEVGIKRRFIISGKPLMSFSQDSWKKARRAGSIAKFGARGIYIFARVKRGRYRGRKYVDRAYIDLLAYYKSNETAILNDIGSQLILTKTT